jgi:hypothetical protein
LGQFLKITSDLRQYVATKLVPRRRIITMSIPNPTIALVVIDLHMVVIQVQVGKNIGWKIQNEHHNKRTMEWARVSQS